MLTFIVLMTPLFIYAQGEFTLTQVMGASFPSELTASSESDLLAWVSNANGVRNIYLSDSKASVRQLTDYDADDGQSLSNLLFTAGNNYLIYSRGSAPNRNGEVPNPRSYVHPAKRELYKINLSDNTTEPLAEGHSPTLSADGHLLSYIHKGQVYLIDLMKDQEPQQIFSIRGSVSDLTWSPDGQRLAFVSNRKDHSYIGIYNRLDATITYLAPGVDFDTDPMWSPDSRHIVFLKRPREADYVIFFAHKSGLPWSICIGDTHTGQAQIIWTAKEGRGSVYREISGQNQLMWTSSGHIVFPWEESGYTQLYSIDADGSNIRQLSRGKSEVQYVNISHDRKVIHFSSNEGDTDRQHIWSATFPEGRLQQMSYGTGIEWSPIISSSGTHLYCLASSGTLPAHVARIEGKKVMPLTLDELLAFPSQLLVEPEDVRITAADGLTVHGQLFKPRNMVSGRKYPAVIFFHGGSRRQMLLGFHHRDYYHNAYSFNQYLASQGYIVLSVNYRSGIGYGLEFREATNYGAGGASEMNDVLGAGLWLRQRSDVDPDKIGLWGGSYGGYLTAMGLAKAPDLFAAGVDIHGVHDWNVVIRNFMPDYNPLERTDISKIAYESSPMAYIKDWKAPVLLIHGDDDRNVPFSETVDIVEALRRHKVYFEQLVFPDEVHGFLLHSNWVKAYEAAFSFFERKLK